MSQAVNLLVTSSNLSANDLPEAFSRADFVLTNRDQTQWIAFALDNPKAVAPTMIAYYQGSIDEKLVPSDKRYTDHSLLADLWENMPTIGDVPEAQAEAVAEVFSQHLKRLNQTLDQQMRIDVEQTPDANLINLWLLRILNKLGGHREFMNERGFRNDNLAERLGLSYLETDFRDFDLEKAKYLLRQQLVQAEAQQDHCHWHPVFAQNLQKLKQALGLSDIDLEILGFTIHLHTSSLLDDTADFIGFLTSDKFYRALSVILNLPEADINRALNNQGMLARSGLVKIDRDGANRMRGKVDLIGRGIYDLMMEIDFNPMQVLRDIVSESKAAELSLDVDYPHFQSEMDIIVPYIKHALATGKRGVNMFLYGEPGTGKTQFVRALAETLSVGCYEVSTVDEDGDPINGHRRLGAYASAQNLLKQSPCVLMFDEVEDIFSNEEYGRKSPAQANKAWFNQMLEDNLVPTIWISNHERGIDPAFIRRYDLTFEMPMPSKKVREKMLSQFGQGLLSEEAMTRFAKHEHLAPAVIERAVKVITPIAETLRSKPVDETSKTKHLSPVDLAFEQIVNHTLNLQGHRKLEEVGKKVLPEAYSLDYMNTQANMANILTALTEQKSARICLYGPPGTGKTAYGHYLSQQLDRPLHLKKASDLLSMWVGGTEANMAKAFKEAEEDKAILLIDEVDSFISNRDNAVRSWEVTAINEMLTQMESYEGIFIATTNRMDGLDPAALRRFDIKIKVDYLSHAQLSKLFAEHCQIFGIVSEGACKLDHLTNITPGDFAAIRRQHKFNPVQSADQLVALLEEESKLKQDKKGQRIGF